MITIETIVPELPANRKIHAIMAKSLESLACLFHDCEKDIQTALSEGAENVTISHSIVLNLGKNKQTDKLSVSIKRGDEITCTIPDPDQPDLFNADGSPRVVTPETPTATPSVMGLPAPVPGIAMIEAEIIGENADAEKPGLSEDQVWVLGAPKMLDDLYADHELSRDKYPWCGIECDGEVVAFKKEPQKTLACWKRLPFERVAAEQVVGKIEADGAMELWFWNGEQWERKYTDKETEGGEEE